MQRCFMRPPPGRRSLAWGDNERAATAFVGGGIARLDQRAEDAKKLAQTAADVASGRVKLSTIYEEGKNAVEEAARTGADLVKDPEKRKAVAAAVADKVDQLKQSVVAFANEPPEQQMEDMSSAAGGGAADLGINAVVGGAVGVGTEATGLAKLARKGKRTEEALAKATKAEKRAAKLQAAEEETKHAASTATAHAEQGPPKGTDAPSRSRVQHMQPDPAAEGEHTTVVRDPKTKKVYKYQQWDQNGMPVKRADVGSNSSHPSPHTHHPAGQDHMHDYAPPNRAPDGRLYPGKETGTRNLEPHEKPK
jgi:hypothetical protein